MLDGHAHVMQVKLCKANTRGVTSCVPDINSHLALILHASVASSGTLVQPGTIHMASVTSSYMRAILQVELRSEC